ncbi:MAG: glycosyltransferase family 4 protein [Chlorobi bacterium]|nr:glycosyltransferase family 4 protein [Chlorobiota bacterium]
MKVSFLTTSHNPEDDRIFYHQAVSLKNDGHSVEIISTKTDQKEKKRGININSFNGNTLSKKDKTNKIIAILSCSEPDIIICSEPLAIYAADKFRRKKHNKVKIIYDITEWYPSKKNLAGLNIIKKPIKALTLIIFNLYTARKTDAFIFGEWFKSRPYRLLFPNKRHVCIPYYPDLTYLTPKQPGILSDKLRLLYSGKLSKEKGFGNFLKVIKELSIKRPELNIYVKTIGWYINDEEKNDFEKQINDLPENINLSHYPVMPFPDYLKVISDTDIFLDLRSDDIENTHCLPIKIFYFAALKRPVIYSDLKAIKKETEIDKFGFLVKPRNTKETVGHILNYIEDKHLYDLHCTNAEKLANEKYNWKIIENRFKQFVNNTLSAG